MHVLGCTICPTLCNPMASSRPGSPGYEMSQVRILEWAVMPSSRGFSRPRDRTCISCVSYFGRQIVHHCVTWPFAGTFLGCQPKSLCWPLQHSSLRVIRLILWLFKSPSTSVPVNTTEAVLHFLI